MIIIDLKKEQIMSLFKAVEDKTMCAEDAFTTLMLWQPKNKRGTPPK